VWPADAYPPGKADGNAASRVHMDESIVLRVTQLKRWRAASATNQAATLRLYLAGVLLKNVLLTPTVAPAPPTPAEKPANTQTAANPQSTAAASSSPATEPSADDDVSYFLAALHVGDGASDVHAAWSQALGSIIDRKGVDVPVSIGTDTEAFPAAAGATIQIEVYPSPWWWIALLLVLALAGVLLWAAFGTTALRDPNGTKNPPFSLARTQMAAWFFVIVASYLFLWLVTGTAGAPSSTALTLMGISGATGLVATTMDRTKRQQTAKARVELEALNAELASTALPAQLAAASAGSPAATTLTTMIDQKTARRTELAAQLAATPAPQPSDDPLTDVLSDEQDITIHRLQMLTWTIVLIVVFVHSVLTDLVMPVFDATLLGLMGISAGAYLGFKFPEPAP
jgi:hypothetical protein